MTDQQFIVNLIPLHRQMYGLAMAVLADSQAAADCVQETMMNLWLRRGQIEIDGSVKTYAMTAIRNQCRSYLRGIKPTETLDNQNEQQTLTASVRDEAETEAVVNSTSELIAKAIRRMPDNMRRVMLLSVFGECDNQEIQQITGLTEVNVRVLLSRGRKELRSLLINLR